MVLCKIWYYSYNLKNEKNTHGGVLLLVKLQASVCNFTKRTVLHGCFSRFLNCVHGTKSRNAPHIEGMASDADLFTPTLFKQILRMDIMMRFFQLLHSMIQDLQNLQRRIMQMNSWILKLCL